jgi:purine-binding chemotaxis protein CheW
MTALHVVAHVGGEQYGVPVEDVLEVADAGDIVPVPGSGAALLGVRNLRGQVLPVVDLAAVLGLPRTAMPGRVVVVADGGRAAGLGVDSVKGVESLPEGREEADSPHLTAAAVVDSALVGLVNVTSVLDAAEGAHAP